MFYASWTVVLVSVHLARSGYIDVEEDRMVSVDPEEDLSQNDTDHFEPNVDSGRSLAVPDSKDLLLPLLTGVALKIFSFAPLVFALLGWLSGVGLATGKLALVLSVGLALYQYVSQTPLVVSSPIGATSATVTKEFAWENPTVEGAWENPTVEEDGHAELSHQWYQPQESEELFQRDRVMKSSQNSRF